MSEAQTNPEEEVGEVQTTMFDVLFGSEETTNPEQALEETSDSQDDEEEAEELQAGDQVEEEEDYEVDVEEAQTETPASYSVKIDGEEVEVSLDELRNGYQRQADYTRKSQSLAEQRKTYEANVESVQAERNQYSQALEAMARDKSNELNRFQNLDWAALKENDPMDYMEKRIEFQDAKDRVAQVQNEQVRVQNQNRAEMADVLEEKIQRESESLVKALPQYADPTSNLKNELREYTLGLGFSPEDVDGITDHRVVLVLHKAMMGDKSVSSPNTTTTKSVPKVVRSGTPTTKAQRSRKEVQAKRERLAKTGNRHDAADVFLDFVS